jgi:hypothetical protein
MTPATKMLCESLIRLAKGMIDACEKWVKAQRDGAGPSG